MDRRCDALVAAGLRALVVVNSGLSQASPGQVRLCSPLGLGARLSHLRDRSRRCWVSFSSMVIRSVPALVVRCFIAVFNSYDNGCIVDLECAGVVRYIDRIVVCLWLRLSPAD